MNFDDTDQRDQARHRKMQSIHDEMMKKYGWYAHYVPNDSDSPTEFNAHTHGFEQSWKHPDVQIVVYMPQPQLHGILVTVADLVKEGKKFEPGVKYDEILHDFPVMFAWAKEGGRKVLRMILPDKDKGVARNEIKKPYSVQWEGTEE